MGDHRSQSFWRAVLGGALAGLAPASAGPLLMIPSLALLWSIANRPRLAAIWGLLAVLVSHRWLLALHPLTWMGVPAALSLPIAAAIWLFCALCGSALLAVWSALSRWLDATKQNAGLWTVLLLASIWGLAEVGLASMPLFWLGIGGSVLPFDPALAGLSRWIGNGGLAALQLVLAWGLWIGLSHRRGLLWGLLWLLSVLLVHLLGAASLQWVSPSQAELHLAAWQPVIPTREKFSLEQQRQLPALVQAALHRADSLSVEALVAPEGLLPSNWRGAFRDQPISLITGGFRWDVSEQRSSLLLIEPDALKPQPLRDKHRLVPLGEALPPLPSGWISGLSAVGGLRPGSASRFVDGFEPPISIAICYEISDGRALAQATAAGAQWLLTIANLDPYPVLLQKQFLALAQLRAIETGRDLLSVANTGPTALIGAQGRVMPLIPPGQEGVAKAVVHLRSGLTPYVRWAEWPLIVLLAAAWIGLLRSSAHQS